MNGHISNQTITNARIAGDIVYYPAMTKPDGTKVDQRAIVPLYSNLPGKRGDDGIRMDGPTVKRRVTFWGKAAEDVCKNGCIGKEFTIVEMASRDYTSPVYIDGKIAVDKDGKQVERSHVGWSAAAYRWGDDSAKRIAFEIGDGRRTEGYDGRLNIKSMLTVLASQGPQGLVNYVQQHANDEEAFKGMLRQRQLVTYQPGAATFGNAKVEGTASNVNAPMVDGFTKDQYIASGWTEAQLRADARFAPFFVGSMPAPPAPPAAPMPPSAPTTPAYAPPLNGGSVPVDPYQNQGTFNAQAAI